MYAYQREAIDVRDHAPSSRLPTRELCRRCGQGTYLVSWVMERGSILAVYRCGHCGDARRKLWSPDTLAAREEIRRLLARGQR